MPPIPRRPEAIEHIPYAPFPLPVPIPSVDFDAGDLYYLAMNGQWLARVLGALETLLETDTWIGDLAAQQAAVDQCREMLIPVQPAGGGGMAIGTVFSYMTDAPPAGSVALDGTIYLDTDYPDFWAVIDPLWKTDATHWRAPDARDRFLVGAGSTYAPGDAGGAASVALSGNQIPSHYHGMGYDPGSGTPAAQVVDKIFNVATRTSTYHYTAAYGANEAHENRPPFLAMKKAVQVE